jgi:hypothetical protein
MSGTGILPWLHYSPVYNYSTSKCCMFYKRIMKADGRVKWLNLQVSAFLLSSVNCAIFRRPALGKILFHVTNRINVKV